MSANKKSLIRIGVFYDGNYFFHVSNYYNYAHERKSRLSISGLHNFVREYVADMEGTEKRYCQIVDAHYFRGRLSAREASQRGNQLYYERVFDDVLMSEGIITHYLPLRHVGGRREEKGIDVWLALEAFELTLFKKFDVVVFIASDGDYVPLMRKLNTLGTRVMVLSWDFEYTDHEGNNNVTRTSQDLLEEVTYPIAMHDVIDKGLRKNDSVISNLFVSSEVRNGNYLPKVLPQTDGEVSRSEILAIKNGYGFIRFPPNNLFFHYSDVEDIDFNELMEGDPVEFEIGENSEGEPVAKNVRLLALEDLESSYLEEEGR